MASALARYGDFLRGRAAPPAVERDNARTEGPWQVDEGWIPTAWGNCMNFWQLGKDPLSYGESAVVEACVSAYSQTIAMLPAAHMRRRDDKGVDEIVTSDLSRILLNPNRYQTRSDFMLNLVRSLFLAGNAYAVATRNGRGDVDELHLLPPRVIWPQFAEDGSVFYGIGGNPFLEYEIAFQDRMLIPARDVLHIKLNSSYRNPLVGETPLLAAAWSIAQSGAISRSSTTFFLNQSRPSGVLKTASVLTAPQVTELRSRWEEHSRGMGAGRVPILSNGLEWQSLTLSAADAQLIEQMKWTATDIARVMRIPSAMINDLSGSTFQTTSALMSWWLASGLGFCLNHVELAFDRFFDVKRGDQTVFETAELLRSDFSARIDALVKGVQGGVYSPNEARAIEELPRAKDGDQPRVQQQVVPLSYWQDQLDLEKQKIEAAKAKPPESAAPKAPDPAAPAPAPTPKPAPSKEAIIARIKAAKNARLRTAA